MHHLVRCLCRSGQLRAAPGSSGRVRPGRRSPAAGAVPLLLAHGWPGYASIHSTRWSELDRGGHFAAIQAPDLLIKDVRAFFRGLR